MPERTIRLTQPLRIVDSGARGGGGPTRERIISEVTLREPTGRDLLLIDRHEGHPVEMALALVQALSGLTRLQVGKLAAPDVEVLSRAALDAAAPAFAISERARRLSHRSSDRPT